MGIRVVLLGCGVIGVGMLLPMNFYFNADAYWKYKWRVIGNSTQSFDLGENFFFNLVREAFIKKNHFLIDIRQ